jgi:TfoX/Sxy family transcriptional regulator of competence genes
MAYDAGLAERLRDIFDQRSDVVEKRMFGGLCFMVSGHMCCGIVGETLMARIGPDIYEECLKQQYVREMDFTGKAMKGFVYVQPEGIAEDSELSSWVDKCIGFVLSLPKKKA